MTKLKPCPLIGIENRINEVRESGCFVFVDGEDAHDDRNWLVDELKKCRNDLLMVSTEYEQDCMRAIADFIEHETAKQKATWKKPPQQQKETP